MTTIRLAWGTAARSGMSGTVTFTPTRRYWREDTRVADEAAPVTVTVPESPGTADVDLDPTGESWCYAVTWTPDGPMATEWTEYVTVPTPPDGDPLGAIPYRDLLKLTRDAAAVLTGERALTAAAALATVQGTAETVADSVERADDAAATAAGAVQQAADAAEQARDAATLSQDSALSVMPMLSGSVNIAPQGGTLAVDLGRAVNVATGLAGTSGAVDVTFPDVTTPDGRVNPDGLGTLLSVAGRADLLTWPGGTVVHGRPPAGGGESFASVVRVGGVVHVVWSVVDQTPPPIAGGAASIRDVAAAQVNVPPGGSVVTDGTDAGGWQFSNLTGHDSTDLTLTAGMVTTEVQSAGAEARMMLRVTFATGGELFTELQVSPLSPPWETPPPPEGLGVIIATRAGMADMNLPPGQEDAWARLQEALGFRAKEYQETPGDYSSPRWLAMRMADAAEGWEAVSEWGGVYQYHFRPDRPSITPASSVWARAAGDFAALGISLPVILVPVSELDARAGGGGRE